MKGIRARVTTAVILVTCLSFLAVACSVYFTIGSVYREREGNNLCDTAERLTKIAAGVMGKTNINDLEYTNILEMIYEDDIQAYSESTGYYIITVDKYDRVIFSSKNVIEVVKKSGIPQNFINRVLAGESFKGTNDLSDYYGTEVITAAYPVMENGYVIGAVICSLEADYLYDLRSSTMSTMLIVMLPIMLIGIVAAYIISYSITKPIMGISKVSKLIASGDLSQRVNIKSKNELGELARNFNEMAQALESADKMKNSFISDVSHELRTPMTIIIGFLQGIADGTVPVEEHPKYIGICLDESRRLSRLVTQLLDTARMEADVNTKMTVFELNEKIRKNIFRFKDPVTDKKIKIYGSFQERELFVEAQGDNIDRVLTNLLDNAVKFTPEEGRIIVSTRKVGDKAEIKVENSGEGISEEELAHIWEKFYKTDKSRSQDKKGAGLGLYIVKRIINGHGERITVSCRENPEEQTKYTTFEFKLKLSNKESAENGSKN